MPLQYTLRLAGQTVNCAFQYPQNVRLCRDFILSRYGGRDAVGVTEIERQIYREAYPEDTWGCETESKAIIGLVSDELLPHNRMIFHSVAFFWHGRAWLITAPSGTGKTTQYRNLKELYGDEIQIICGDNPVLHMREDGVIMVHPSPWRGKERYGSDLTAPLGGIIWLQQAKSDKIAPLPLNEAVYPIFHEINTYAKTPERVRILFRLEERLITSVPIWKFENTGTPDSSKLLIQCLRDCEEKEQCDAL